MTKATRVIGWPCQNNRGMAVTHILRHFCTDLWIVRQFQLFGVSLVPLATVDRGDLGERLG